MWDDLCVRKCGMRKTATSKTVPPVVPKEGMLGFDLPLQNRAKISILDKFPPED